MQKSPKFVTFVQARIGMLNLGKLPTSKSDDDTRVNAQDGA